MRSGTTYRRYAGWGLVIALVVSLATGCTITRGLENYRAWLEGQPILSGIDGPEQSTGSISSGLDKRAIAGASVKEDATSAELDSLARGLESFMAGKPGFKEAHLTLTLGPDQVTLSGRRGENESMLTAYRTIRDDPGLWSVDMGRLWRANGITEDVRTTAELAYDTANHATDGMVDASRVLSQLPAKGERPTEASWTMGTSQGASSDLRLWQLEPMSAATVAAALPALDTAGASVSVGEPYSLPGEEKSEWTVTVSDAATALDLHTQLASAGSAAFPDGLVVESRKPLEIPLTMRGATPATPAETRMIQRLLVAEPRALEWSASDGYIVTLNEKLREAAPYLSLLPEETKLTIIHKDREFEYTVSGTTSEVRVLHPRFGAARDAGEIKWLTVSPGHVEVMLSPLSHSVWTQKTIPALRGAGWDGAWQIHLSGYADSNVPVDLTFNSTPTGRATGVDATKGIDDAPKDQRGEAGKAWQQFIAEWDATASSSR